MTFSRRLIFLTAITLALGLSACEQQSSDSGSATQRSDRTGQGSANQPGSTTPPSQGSEGPGSDSQRSTNPSSDRP